MNIENVLANVNDGSNYQMACVACGQQDRVHMIAHRNEKGNICGWIFSCDPCSKGLAHKTVIFSESDNDSGSKSENG